MDRAGWAGGKGDLLTGDLVRRRGEACRAGSRATINIVIGGKLDGAE